MSSASSISSQPPVAYAPPAPPAQDPKAAEKAAKVNDLTATAVAAQAVKEAGKGRVVDIQV